MSAVHTVTVEVDEDGTPWRFEFACSGGDSDRCRQWCAEDTNCEECSWEVHRWEPVPYCREITWLDGCGAHDTYIGADDGEPIPARSGRIDIEWDGDGYLWRYAEPTPVVATAATHGGEE